MMEWFLLSLAETALFAVAGFVALYYRGLWVTEKRKNENRSPK